MSREQTRALLLRSLNRANLRQKAVARRRTTLRYVAWLVRWSVTAVVSATGLLWAAMALNLIPQLRLVTVDRMQTQKPHDATLATAPSAAEHSAIVAGSINGVSAVQVKPDQWVDSSAEDQASPIELKAESHLNSLKQ